MISKNPRVLVALVIALAGLGITAWKGPSAWGTFASTVTALCIFVLPLLARAAKTDPKIAKVEEYVADVEDELEGLDGGAPRLAAIKAKHGRLS